MKRKYPSRLCGWSLIHALLLTSVAPSTGLGGQPAPLPKETLRVQQPSGSSVLPELRQDLTGGLKGTPGQTQSSGMEELPPSPVVSWLTQEVGQGWKRFTYKLENEQMWPGGLVRNDVPLIRIHPTAYVSPTSFVAGAASRLGEGAVLISGSAVTDSVVLAGARLSAVVADRTFVHRDVSADHAVFQPAYDKDDWSYSDQTSKDPTLSVENHEVVYEGGTYLAEVGEKASVRSTVVNGSSVGAQSDLSDSALVITRLGPESRSNRVKWNLTTAVGGKLEAAGIQHLPDRTIPAATEISESAILGVPADLYPGTQFSIRNLGYTELIALNRIPLVSYQEGRLAVRWYDKPVPPLMLLGDGAIFSIFAGSPSPSSIKTNGQPTPGLISRISGAPGEQVSQHGRIVSDPLAVVAGFTKIIGRLLGFPDISDPQAVQMEQEVTHLGALSVSGVDEQMFGLAGPEVWGQLFPGEARGQLSRGVGVAPWIFVYSPETIFTLMGWLSEGLPEGKKEQYDDLPKLLLESGLALARWHLNQEEAKAEKQRDLRLVARYTHFVEGFEMVLRSGAWDGPWVQTGSGLRMPAHWHAAGDQWQSDRLSLARLREIHQMIHPVEGAPYRQFSVAQLMTVPSTVGWQSWERFNPYYAVPEDFRTEPVPPQLPAVPAEEALKLSAWRIIGQDERYYYTLEGGRIGREVNLQAIAHSAVVGPGTVLTGRQTTVGEESRLFHVVADEARFGAKVTLNFVKASRAVFGDRVKLSWAKVNGGGPAAEARVGAGTTGLFVGISGGSQVGPNNTLNPFALIIDSTTAPSNVVGGRLVNTRLHPGYMNMHLSTTLLNVQHEPVIFEVKGKKHDVGAGGLNAAGGAVLGVEKGQPVRFSSAYPLSNTTIGEAAQIGAFSVLKDEVERNAVLLPLTFSAFSNLPVIDPKDDPRFGHPGRFNDRLGGALDMPGIFLRNFIYRTKKGIRDDLLSQGVSDEQVRAHRRLSDSDYMVEAIILGMLREVMERLRPIDPAAFGSLREPVERLSRILEEDLAQIDRENQVALGARDPEVQAEILSLIRSIDDSLTGLLDVSRGKILGKISPSGHSGSQLLEGIRRFVRNLDGRWRMRNQTFTEIRWRYVGFDEQGRARDTWVPEPVPPASLASADNTPQPSPVGEEFSPAAVPAAGAAAPLAQWRKILDDPEGSGLLDVLRRRYGNDLEILQDRLEAYRRLIQGAVASGFDPEKKVVITVASPGRDRVFMGHTDFPGLGGPTIDAGTQEEILAVLQATDDRTVYFTNPDPAYQGVSFILTGPDPVHQGHLKERMSAEQAGRYPFSEIQDVARNRDLLMESGGWPWPVSEWDSYPRAALAYLLADAPDAEAKIGSQGFRFHVASTGKLKLSTGMGSSSSSALNLAMYYGLNQLFGLGLTPEKMGRVDFSEQLLGKKKGGGDSMAIVNARKGKVVVTGSYPERFIQMVDFPSGLAVLMAESSIPRLTTPEGLEWLKRKLGSDDKAHTAQVWASETLYRFSGRAYERAVKDLLEALTVPFRYQSAGINDGEAAAVRRALMADTPNGLMRELAAGGAIERELAELAGWENRRKRYNLIYRLMRLLPESVRGGVPMEIRKTALYGIAEVERGAAYVRELEAAVAADRRNANAEKKAHIARVLELVRAAHDGDRAAEDYRQQELDVPVGDPRKHGIVFPPTAWAAAERNGVFDGMLDLLSHQQAELADVPGGFERSLPDLDEIADEANRRFKGKVAMRVAAAGLGGSMALHVDATDGEEIVAQVKDWLAGLGWKVREVKPGAAPEIIAPPKPKKSAGLEEWVGQVDWESWADITNPDKNLIQSFSGIRALAGQAVSLPVEAPLPDTGLSPAYKLVFGRYGYLFGRHQIQKFQQDQPDKNEFTIVLGRDPRPSGKAIMEAQMRGILVAAQELGVKVRFIDGGILPTPFVEALVRQTGADGGIISTASHNPLVWNGVKYPTAAKEPGEALLEAGVLLPASQMSGIVSSFQKWGRDVGQTPALANDFVAALNAADPAGTIRAASAGSILKHVVAEARKMWGLENPTVYRRFKRQAKGIKIVVDPNGGAASGWYADFLNEMGFTVIEINNTVGQPRHLIEPIRTIDFDALGDAEKALKENKAHFAIITDYDADRANTLLRDPETNEVIEPRPQEVAAMNVALALAHARATASADDKRPLAVVVHGATSRRVLEISRAFGAKIFVVDVGEVNVLEKMRAVEKEGYRVVIGVEGANGGSVFRGLHPVFQGDTSRNGAMTGLFVGMVAMDPLTGWIWLEARNSAVPAGVPQVHVPEAANLVELLKSLPGERGKGAWHFETPLAKQGSQGEVPEALVIPFKRSLQNLWYSHYWPVLRDTGITLSDGTVQRFTNFRIVHHAETKESPAYGPGDVSDAGLNQYGMEGWTLELDLAEYQGQAGFIWTRGSLTEGFLRVSAEGQGEKAAELAKSLLALFQLDLYPTALTMAKATAMPGLAPLVGRPLPVSQRAWADLPLPDEVRQAVIDVAAEYQPGTLSMWAPESLQNFVFYLMATAPIRLDKWQQQAWIIVNPRHLPLGPQIGVLPTDARRNLLTKMLETSADLNAVVYALWSRLPEHPMKGAIRADVEDFVSNSHSHGVTGGLEENVVARGIFAGETGRIPATVVATSAEIGKIQADEVFARWSESIAAGKKFIIGLATGSTPKPLLSEMAARLNEMDSAQRRDYLNFLSIVAMDDIVDPATGNNVLPGHERSAVRFFKEAFFSRIDGFDFESWTGNLFIPRPGQVSEQVRFIRKMGGVRWQLMATDPNEGHVAEVAAGERYRDPAVQAAKDQPRVLSPLFLQHNAWASGYRGITFTLDDFVDMLAPDGVVSFAIFGESKKDILGRFVSAKAYDPDLPISFLWLPELVSRTTLLADQSAAQSVLPQLQPAGLEEKNDKVLALELGGTFIRGGLVDRKTGNFIVVVPDWQIQYPVQPANSPLNADSVLQQIEDHGRRILAQAGLNRDDVGAVSMSAAGDLNEATGFVDLQNNLPFTGVPLADRIAARLGGEVLISNDMTAATRGEALYGAGKGRDQLAYLTVSTGTNAANYVVSAEKGTDLRLWGYSAHDGDIVERHTSGTHLARLARERITEPGGAEILALAGGASDKIEGRHVGAAFLQGNPLAAALIENAARVLGRAIVQASEGLQSQNELSNDPDILWVLGGGVSQGIGEPFRALVQGIVDQEMAGSTLTKPIRVVVSQMNGTSRGLLGAAARTLESVGLEERIQLPEGALSNKVVFLGPEVATPVLFSGMAGLRPAPGERLGLVLFARDAVQKQEIEAGLEQYGLVPLEPVIDVAAQYGGDLYAAVSDRQLSYMSRNVDVHVLFTFAGLKELGRFLHIPDVSFRTWQQKITGSALDIQA